VTTIHEQPAGDGPQTHALIIGVGKYKHLPGGEGPVLKKTFGLKQLTTPPLSATALANWMVSNLNNPAVPLGSVEMVLSPAQRYTNPGTGSSIDVAAATIANIQAAFDAWYDRCDSHPDNVAIFYFCGHGIARDNHYLLAEDFGASEKRPLQRTIDLERTHTGMARCAARTQILLIDACREVPYQLQGISSDDQGVALIEGRIDSDMARDAPILSATMQGRKAYGPPDSVTNFTRALIRALDGAGAEQVEDVWRVTYLGVVKAVLDLLSTLIRPGAKKPEQLARSRGEAGDALLHISRIRPLVPVTVFCQPPAGARYADLAVISLNDPNGRFVRAPTPGEWSLEAPAGLYQLRAEFPQRPSYRPFTESVVAWPPSRRWKVRVTS
jgi:Caspase domain